MAKKYFNVDLETSGEVKCATLDVNTIEGPVNFEGEVTSTSTFQPAIGFTIPDRLSPDDPEPTYNQPSVFSHKEKVTGVSFEQIYALDTLPATYHVALGTPESFNAFAYARAKLSSRYSLAANPTDAAAFYSPQIDFEVRSRDLAGDVVSNTYVKLVAIDENDASTEFKVWPEKAKVTGDLDITGDCTADSFTPFSGKHIYPADSTLSIGGAVVLEEGVLKLSSSSNSTVCVGIVARYFDTAPAEEEQLSSLRQALTTGYAHVISVGDSRVSSCQGFNVCNENGDIQPGDLLVTSSTPGYLMKQDDDIMRSKTVGKSMEAVTFDDNGQATGVYGFIYCG